MNHRQLFATAAILAGVAGPGGALAQAPGYRQVLLDPVVVSYRPGWLRDINAGRSLADRFTAPEADRLARSLGRELHESLDQAFRRRGLQPAGTPAEGVLKVTARIEALDVFAPGHAPLGGRTYVREAGSATIVLEAREAASGRLVKQWREPATTPRLGEDFLVAGPVATHARFAALFRGAADDFAASLASR